MSFKDFDNFTELGDDNFLSASGKERKAKRKAKKAESKTKKEAELRQKKGMEISQQSAKAAAEMMGIPYFPPPAEEKKGLLGRLKDKNEKRKADKLFKKDLDRSKKEGTLSKAEFPESKEKKQVDLLSGLGKAVNAGKSLLGLSEEEDEPTKKPTKNAGIKPEHILFGLVAIGGIWALYKIGTSKGINPGGK